MLTSMCMRAPSMRQTPLDDRRRVKMGIDIAKGMAYLHSADPPIVHRDLKSPNLLVDETFTVRLSFVVTFPLLLVLCTLAIESHICGLGHSVSRALLDLTVFR
jgi:serine/threonine protein kinase